MSRALQPDGYTILFGSRSAAIDMTLYKHPSYSLQNDLSPIVLVANQPTFSWRARICRSTACVNS